MLQNAAVIHDLVWSRQPQVSKSAWETRLLANGTAGAICNAAVWQCFLTLTVRAVARCANCVCSTKLQPMHLNTVLML